MQTKNRMNMLRPALDDEIRKATFDGISKETKVKDHEGITLDDEKIIWQKGLLGCLTVTS